LQLSEEIIDREKTLEAMLLFALRVEDDSRRRPLGAESLEALWLLFDVDLNGDEILAEGLRYAVIGVNLGFQPSAPRSHRGGAEIEEDRPPALLCFRQGGIGIAIPVYFHVTSIVHVDKKGKGGGKALAN